jgi:plasmid stabilization system protein ParE
MKVTYLTHALRDMNWVRKYYKEVFPAGRSSARSQLRRTETLISENPLIGRSSETVSGAREFHISRTPFSFLYRVAKDHIEIVRVIDNRSNWDGKSIEDENFEEP